MIKGGPVGSMPDWWLESARAVPPADTPGCCRTCRGTTGGPGFDQCWRCAIDWPSAHPEYAGAIDLVAPCTVVVVPSRWYTALRDYKRTTQWSDAQAGALQAALTRSLRSNISDILAALGGAVNVVTAVPSTTTPMPTRLLQLLQAMRSGGVETIATAVSRPGQRAPKRKLVPDAIHVDADVVGRRIVLIEDTWVSGSRAVSTAIALRRAGAAAIVVIPIARKVDSDAMTVEYDAAAAAT